MVVLKAKHKCKYSEMPSMNEVLWISDLQVLNLLGRSTLMMAIRYGND